MKITPIFMAAVLSWVAVTFAAPIPSPMPLGGLGRVFGKCFGCVDGSKAVRESISHTSELAERPAIPQNSFERPSSPKFGGGSPSRRPIRATTIESSSPPQSVFEGSDSPYSSHEDSPGLLHPSRPEQGVSSEPLTFKNLGSQGQSVPLPQTHPIVAPQARQMKPMPESYQHLDLTGRPHPHSLAPQLGLSSI